MRVGDLRRSRRDLADQPIQRRRKAGVAERAGTLLGRRSALPVQDAILQGPVSGPLLVFIWHRGAPPLLGGNYVPSLIRRSAHPTGAAVTDRAWPTSVD